MPLAPLGLRLSRASDHDWSDTANFIPLESTLSAAREAQLSVGDYVDSVMNKTPGMTQRTIDAMEHWGVFRERPRRVLEIGPGTGRYLEKTIRRCQPELYQIYETASAWSSYLVQTYGVTLEKTDGSTLSSTPDQSVDLAQAHKVFSAVPFMVTCCYWHELVRVVRPGGWVVFDVLTESCLGDEGMLTWARSGTCNGTYPAVMPRSLTVGFFERRGFDVVSSQVVAMPPATTELFAFRRRRGAPA